MFSDWLHKRYMATYATYDTYLQAYQDNRMDTGACLSKERFNELESIFNRLGADSDDLLWWLLYYADRLDDIEYHLYGESPRGWNSDVVEPEGVSAFITYMVESGYGERKAFFWLFDEPFNWLANVGSAAALLWEFKYAGPNIRYFLEEADYEYLMDYFLDGVTPEYGGDAVEGVSSMVEYAARNNLQMRFCWQSEEKKRIVDPIAVTTAEDDRGVFLCWDPEKDCLCRYQLDGMTHIQLCNTVQTEGMSQRQKKACRANP